MHLQAAGRSTGAALCVCQLVLALGWSLCLKTRWPSLLPMVEEELPVAGDVFQASACFAFANVPLAKVSTQSQCRRGLTRDCEDTELQDEHRDSQSSKQHHRHTRPFTHQLRTFRSLDRHFVKGITSVVGNIFGIITDFFPRVSPLASMFLPVLSHFKR